MSYHYEQVQQRLLALSDYVATGAARHLERAREIGLWLLAQREPQVFDEGDARNVLVVHRQHFGERCAVLAEHGHPQAQQLSVFDFYAAIAHLLAKQRPVQPD